MSDEQTPIPPVTTADSATPPAGAKNTDSAPAAIPYERFQEVVKARQALESQLADYKKRDEQAAQSQQTDKLTQAEAELAALRPYREKAEKLEAKAKQTLERRLEKVPDHIKKLLVSMETGAALDWLDENAEQLAPRQAPPTDAGAGSGRQDASYFGSPKHQEDVASRYGIPFNKKK